MCTPAWRRRAATTACTSTVTSSSAAPAGGRVMGRRPGTAAAVTPLGSLASGREAGPRSCPSVPLAACWELPALQVLPPASFASGPAAGPSLAMPCCWLCCSGSPGACLPGGPAMPAAGAASLLPGPAGRAAGRSNTPRPPAASVACPGSPSPPNRAGGRVNSGDSWCRIWTCKGIAGWRALAG